MQFRDPIAIGPMLVLAFAVSQAFRDIYFGGVFQVLDFFEIILLAFAAVTGVALSSYLLRTPEPLKRFRHAWSDLILANATTTVAWIGYFFALKFLEPAIVMTLFSAMGPITVVALSFCGIHIAGQNRGSRSEPLLYVGLLMTVVTLYWVVLSGRSGLAVPSLELAVGGLSLAVMSGISITISTLYSRRLNDQGIGADAVFATRFLGIVAVAAIVVGTGDRPFAGIDGDAMLTLGLAAVALIAVPSYLLQMGIARTSPLTVQTIRQIGPLCLLAAQALDPRIGFSVETLACVLAYAGFVIGANVMRYSRTAS
jgi:drug/metabolite transporter (DMT)-like permease